MRCHRKEVLTVLPNVSSAFQNQLAQDKQAFDRATVLEYERRSIGECFRAALKSWWQRREIEEITKRLDKVRQGIMMAATVSIWYVLYLPTMAYSLASNEWI